MNYDSVFRVFLCFFFSGTLISCIGNKNKSIASPANKPNIVFIMADDLGWADLPVYGNKFNEAHNIDKLRSEGMLFTDAYAAAPVCSPTRASIQSGQYPARVGITDFITGHWRPYEELTVPINRTQYLPQELETVAEAMKGAGYATGYYGKWHLGNKGSMPDTHGYDDHRVHTRGMFYNLKKNKAISPSDESIDDEIRVSELLTDYSLEFIEKNKDEPFFLFLSHYDVHVQLDGDQDLIDKYLAKEKWGDYPCNAIYAAMIEHIDRSVGRVVNKLDELGLAENTIIIFYSDNGGLVSRFDEIPLIADSKQSIYKDSDLLYVASSNAPLRAEKGTIYEGGIREPLIVRWPGKIAAGSETKQVATSVDFYPTFLEIAGAKGNSNHILDGESIMPTLREGTTHERELFWHYPVYHHSAPAGAVRKGDWKLIENFTDNSIELYNLKEDIGETTNLASANAEKANQLRSSLSKWRTEVAAAMPVKNPNFDEARRYEWGRHPSRK